MSERPCAVPEVDRLIALGEEELRDEVSRGELLGFAIPSEGAVALAFDHDGAL